MPPAAPCDEVAGINLLAERRAGVLLHPTSLPGGRLDDSVPRWLDFMHAAGLSVWQVLPLVIPDRSRSPYHSCSVFAANPALLPAGEPMPGDDQVDAFRARNRHWIEDFALFSVVAGQEGHRAWWRWPEALARRDAGALDSFRRRHDAALRSVIAVQCAIDRRWEAVRREAADRGIAVFGDMPIFVAHESADVWARPDEYLLDGEFQPRYVTGVPPDYFSETGQRWGNPQFDWQRMEERGFDWWHARIDRQFGWLDLLRLDHFRALAAVWMIDADCQTATEGFWVATPGKALLEGLRAKHGALPIVAEDLGYITEDVLALRREFALPGMAVLQFAFDGARDNPHRPENILRDCVAYTGTHDNDTCVGWYASLDESARRLVQSVLGCGEHPDIAGVMIEAVMRSSACLAVAPLQDFLALPSAARMNTPGVPEGNWNWEFAWSDLDGGLAKRIRETVGRTERAAHG